MKYALPERIYNVLYAPIKESIIKQRSNGRQSFDYITGAAVIDILNKAFSNMWNWEIKRIWVEQGIPFYIKATGAYEDQGPVAHVHGTLTASFMDDEGVIRTISRDGCGSKAIIGKQAEQDAIFKSASTDALKKAASTFGIALSLYRDDAEQELFEEYYTEPIDPNSYWNDMTIAKYSAQRDIIVEYFDKHNLSDIETDNLVKEFDDKCTSIEDIQPNNIVQFVEFLTTQKKDTPDAD